MLENLLKKPITRRDFLKYAGVSAIALSTNIEKALADLVNEQYVVQRLNFNDMQPTIDNEIANRLTKYEFLKYFTGANLNWNGYDSLIGLVSGEQDILYRNDTNSLEGRVNIHNNIKNLINANPSKIRGINDGDTEHIVVYDHITHLYVVNLNTNDYIGDYTDLFKSTFGFVPVDFLSLRIFSNSGDDFVALKRHTGTWDIYLWQDLSNLVLKEFDLEGFFNADKSLSPVRSLAAANLYREQSDLAYAVRTPLEGRINDMQTVMDLIDYSHNTRAPYIKRWEPPFPVYIKPPIKEEDVLDAMKFWSSAIGEPFILLDKDEKPRISVEEGGVREGTAGGSRFTELFPNYRVKAGEVHIAPHVNSPSYDVKRRKRVYRHEFGHVIGFNGVKKHLEGGIMNGKGINIIEASPREIKFFTELYKRPHGTRVYDDGTWKMLLNPDGTPTVHQLNARIDAKDRKEIASILHNAYLQPYNSKNHSMKDFLMG